MTETELKDLVQKAQRADELLSDPLIQEFIVVMRGKLLNEFESTQLTDDKAREDVWRKSQVLNNFLEEFKRAIKDGKNAKISLAERAKQAVRRII